MINSFEYGLNILYYFYKNKGRSFRSIKRMGVTPLNGWEGVYYSVIGCSDMLQVALALKTAL